MLELEQDVLPKLEQEISPRRARLDYLEFKESHFPGMRGKLLRFEGAPGRHIYNTTVPFDYQGRKILAGRVEGPDGKDSCVMFFEQSGDSWKLVPESACIPELEDPFFTAVNGKYILGGVHAIWNESGQLVTYHTDFYYLAALDRLIWFAQGPERMKDIRLLQMPDKRIAVFSRPQGSWMEKSGRVAAIGFGLLRSIDELTSDRIADLPLFKWHFTPDEWGGYNQLFALKNGLIGCIGHKSWGERKNGVHVIHYYCAANAVNPDTRQMTPMKIIASRDCFPKSAQKEPRTYDVCFTSGIIRKGGKAELYAGLSDACEGVLEIDDPLREYESLSL